MPIFVVPLKDIITDPDNPVDLTQLPEQDAVQRIKEIYGFFSRAVEVTIANDIATITIPTEQSNQARQAQSKLEQAAAAGKRGRYSQAIQLYQDVLKVLPDHTEARRELAMALMESGNNKAAKQQLIRVLQVNPNDAWAYLLLGNIYFHAEKDLGSAERYYTSAYDAAPDDPYILTNLGGLKAQREQFEEAIPLLERALEFLPAHPNAAYGLALARARVGERQAALDALTPMLEARPADDPRTAPLFAQADKLYLELTTQEAAATHDADMAELRAIMHGYSDAA